MIQSTIDTKEYDIRIKRFRDINVSSHFFDSFRKYYGSYYSEWVKKKYMDPVYLVEDNNNNLIAFMKLKKENEDENYSDINPVMPPSRRLKISSFKVAWGNYGLSLKMMDIAISQAIFNNISEIYGTIPINADYKSGLVNFLHRYGFTMHGIKKSHGIVEEVYIMHLNSVLNS